VAGIPRHNVGRPPNTAPKLAWDYRRYITLIQVLAIGDYNGILALYEAWELEPMPEPDTLVMITRLAEHATEYHRDTPPS
jgi:hypothetical protein